VRFTPAQMVGIGHWRLYLAAEATSTDAFFSKESFSLLQLSHSGRRYQLLSVESTFFHVSAEGSGIAASIAPAGWRPRVVGAFSPDIKPR